MVQLVQTELWPPTLREARSWRPLAVTYSPPTRCPRCRGRVVQTWAGGDSEVPGLRMGRLLASLAERVRGDSDSAGGRFRDRMADVQRAGECGMTHDNAGWVAGKSKAFFEVEAWRPGAHAADCGCGPCLAVSSIVAALIHDGIRERLDRRGGALDADRELTGRSEAAVGRRQRTHESVVESPSGIPPLAAPGPPMAPPKGTSPPPAWERRFTTSLRPFGQGVYSLWLTVGYATGPSTASDLNAGPGA